MNVLSVCIIANHLDQHIFAETLKDLFVVIAENVLKASY